jgi:hypothetical protein
VFNVVIADLTMGKVPKKINVVRTPGSYRVPVSSKTTSTPSKSPLRKTKKVGPGRPLLKKPRKARKPVKERAGYTEADMMEAIRLVREEEFSIKAAARHLNSTKENEVPRQVVIKCGTFLLELPLFHSFKLNINF